jgi:SecD/SecF fusion protein
MQNFHVVLMFAAVALMLIGPFLLGGFLAKLLRMPEYGWKIGLILFLLIVSVSMSAIKWPPKFGIDLSGGVILIYEIDKEQLKQEKKSIGDVDINKLVDAIKMRVNPGGQKEITIRPYGNDEIEIIIPNVTDAEKKRVKEIISETGKLEFRIVANIRDHKDQIELAQKEPNVTTFYADKKDPKRWTARWVRAREGESFSAANYTRERTLGKEKWNEVLVVNDYQNVTGDNLKEARASADEQGPCVNFTFKAAGGHKFGRLTEENGPDPVQNFKRQLAIVLDNVIYSAPSINGTIYDNGQITGKFTEEEVKKIVDVLNAGSLPAALSKIPVQELESDSTLGADTIMKSTYAMIFSAILVIAFMLVYYRFSGMIAVIALILNVLGIVAVMITFKVAFTLTGFAALALTIGMAVDNNVLVYERLREELAKGSALRMAIRNSFQRAGATIIDCNMTHVIVAIVLWIMGSDQIKGFAIALFLGVIFSMFTAVFVSHVLFDIAEKHRWVTKLKMLHIIGHTNFDFMGLFPYCLTFSVVISVLAVAAAFFRGPGLFDIDFTGGVSVQILFEKSHTVKEVEEKLTDVKEVPDLTINKVHAEGEDDGIRFTINTSRRKSENDKLEATELVKNYLTQQFGDELKKNTLQESNVGPAMPKKADTPLKEESKILPPSKPAEKSDGKKDEKPAPEKQSRVTRPAAGWLSLAMAATLIFGQVDALPAQPPADAPKTEAKPAETPATETKAAEPKPAETTPAETKPAEPKPETKPADVPPTTPLPVAPPVADTPPADRFVGGTQADLKFTVAIDHSRVETIINEAVKAAGFTPENVQTDITNDNFRQGDPATERLPFETWNVRLTLPQADAQKVFDAAKTNLTKQYFFPASNSIGAAVAGSTRLQALGAIIASWALIILYLWIRFQGVAFGLAAVIALVHDIIMMLGGLAFSYWLASIPGVSDFLLIEPFKINLPIIAAFLTIIGYSVNDTIVVFDRIRELRGKDPNLTRRMVNEATNQTLSRTIITSLTVFMVVVVLYCAGGPAIRGFSFALTVGVLTGTYSSIYVAAPILLWLVGKHQVATDHPHYEPQKP